jgi:hypothetical protein
MERKPPRVAESRSPMQKLSKKDLYKRSNSYFIKKGLVHREGKYLCDCLVKKYRSWLGKKKYGYEQMRPSDFGDDA